MTRLFWLIPAALLCLPLLAGGEPPAVAPPPRPAAPRVAAVVECTLPSAAGHIRQHACDGDPDTYFASEKNATKADHFVLVFDQPVTLKSVKVTTGRPDGTDALESSTLEVSSDGTKFEDQVLFVRDPAWSKFRQSRVRALRIKPAEDLKHPLVIREIAVDSEPAVAVFKYPVEFVLDVTDAPELREWGEKVVRVCERQYPMICDELWSAGFRPPQLVRMTLSANYNGVAATGGSRIVGSVRYFKAHQDDIGAMVHETVHVVQGYRGRGNPGWLVEGVADYIRFFKYEPGKLGIRLTPERAKYDGSYRVSAAFLAFLVEKHDPLIVKKLNAVMREGKYKAEVWKELTGKTVEELGRAWQNSLAK